MDSFSSKGSKTLKIKTTTLAVPTGTMLIIFRWLETKTPPTGNTEKAALNYIRKSVYECVEFDDDDPRSTYNAKSIQ